MYNYTRVYIINFTQISSEISPNIINYIINFIRNIIQIMSSSISIINYITNFIHIIQISSISSTSSIKLGTFLIMHPCITAGISVSLLSPYLSLYYELFYSSLKCSGVEWYSGTRLVMWRAVMISYLAFANCSKPGMVQI